MGLGFMAALLQAGTSMPGMQLQSQSPTLSGWNVLQPHGKACWNVVPCSLSPTFPWQENIGSNLSSDSWNWAKISLGRSVCYCHVPHMALSACPLCPSLPLTLHQPLLSHQMWFRDIWTWSENALKCRKHMFRLGSGSRVQLFSWGCKYQHNKALSESDKLLILLRALKINFRIGRICNIVKKTLVKPSVLGLSLTTGTSPAPVFAGSAEPACPEVIISASLSRTNTTFLFSLQTNI